MDRFTYTALLFDFYGSMLTGKQKQVIEMYFLNDLSLSEIGEELGISRQAAGTLISRAEKKLLRLESKLELIDKYARTKERAQAALEILYELRDIDMISSAQKAKIDTIINHIFEEYTGGF